MNSNADTNPDINPATTPGADSGIVSGGQSITRKAYARAGLIGNPSDGYQGKTISFTVKNFCAEVTLTESAQIGFIECESGHNQYTDIQAFHSSVLRHGYYGGVRLMKGTVKRFVDYCQTFGLALDAPNFTLSYQSNIPQQVGMAGSSAIIIATLRCLMDYYDVQIAQRVQPSLALAVETNELGIGGGLQDRVIQIYEGLVAMDFTSMEKVDGYMCGRYEPLPVELLPGVYVAYRPDASEPTEVFHNDLRTRFDAGDQQVVDAMKRFAQLTDLAVEALENGDANELNTLLNANFDCRQSFCVLNPEHVEMVEVARAAGVSAKYAGSGGAIVGVYRDEDQFNTLQLAMNGIGCELIRPLLV